MKKILYLSALVLGLGFAACDDYNEPNPPAQYNPQESVLKTDEVSVTPLANSTYNLYELNYSGTPIEMATIVCETLPEAYTFQAAVQISANDFASAYDVPATVVKGDDDNAWIVKVNPDDLQGVYYQNITRDPSENSFNYRVSVMTQTGNQIAYVGGKDYYYGPFDITIVPFPADKVIENAYYLVSSADNWDLSKALKLVNSGKSPYDDPTFSAIIDITGDMVSNGFEWKVVPESTYAAGTMTGNLTYGGVASEENPNAGTLVVNGDNGVVTESGQVRFAVNIEALTYEITSAVDYLYTPGDANGWNQGASQKLFTNDYTNYEGYAYLSTGGFKFTTAPDWDHINYGATGTEGELTTDGSAGNLTVPATATYWCNVNIVALTYSVTEITTYGVIGDATPGGWDASTALTTTDGGLTWEGDIAFSGSGEWKLRANDGWDINLGGDLQDLTPGGANIATPGEGTYHVVLSLGQLPYSVQLTKK